MSATLPADAPDPVTRSLIDLTPTDPAASVVVIGRGTLPLMLAFLRRGCAGATELRALGAAPGAEPAQLAWITGIISRDEADNALRAALHRIGRHGRLAFDATLLTARIGLKAVLQWLRGHGLTVDATRRIGGRVVVLAHG